MLNLFFEFLPVLFSPFALGDIRGNRHGENHAIILLQGNQANREQRAFQSREFQLTGLSLLENGI